MTDKRRETQNKLKKKYCKSETKREAIYCDKYAAHGCGRRKTARPSYLQVKVEALSLQILKKNLCHCATTMLIRNKKNPKQNKKNKVTLNWCLKKMKKNKTKT